MPSATGRPSPAGPSRGSSRSNERRFDVVVFGATGFAGRLTASYLAQAATPGLAWAIAGRSQAKLAAVRDELAALDPALAGLELIVADVADPASLAVLAATTRVVVTTVGPYALYGDALVAACAAAGTDYLDLTGEPEFVNSTYVRHHETAVASGARLIHAAGFDSEPHDLGAYFTVQQLPRDVPITVSGYVRASGAVSGGTFYSALTGFSRPRQNIAAARARRASEQAVAGPRSPGRSARAATGRPHRAPVGGGWAVPLPTLDPQVIARSARTLDEYGPQFRYSHFAVVPHLYMAAAGGAAVAGLVGLAQIPPARRALLRRLAPGDGPSPEKRARSWFTVTFVGEGGGERVVTRVSGGDPGYDETAKMLAESALCLALDDLPATSGQVTSAAAMGNALIDRLRKAGMGFEVLES